MSVLNSLQYNAPENQVLPAKKFGVSNNQSAVKKKPLVDVKNTLHQSVQRVSKPRSKTNPAGKGKNLFNVFNDEKNKTIVRETVKEPNVKHRDLLSEAVDNIDDLNGLKFEPPCHCDCSKNDEDDFNDIYFKHLRLTENEIDNLALNWEHRPVFGLNDKRDLVSFGPVEEAPPSADNLIDYHDPLFDLLELEMKLPGVPLVDSDSESED